MVQDASGMGPGPGHIYGRALAKGMAPIMAQEATASMFQSVIDQKNYLDSLQRRRDLMVNVEEMRSPAALMERARKMEGFGDEARRMLAAAKASGNEAAILDAVRASRRGAEAKKATNLARAGSEAQLGIAGLMQDYEVGEIEAANRERIQQMLFGLYGQQLEAKKYQAGAAAAKTAAPHNIAYGFLVPA